MGYLMINIREFEMADLWNFEPKDSFQDLQRDMKMNLSERHKTMMSLHWKDRTLAIVGLTEFRKGAGELWLLPSVYVDECGLAFFKAVKNLIYGFVFPILKFHRLEIAILKGWGNGMKWAKLLGFEESHTCDAYDEQYRDHVIFKKVIR